MNDSLETNPFEEITKKMIETYKKKNKDYGNSFNKTLNEWGLAVSAIRLEDKLNRFKSYIQTGMYEVQDEGVKDTLMDLANYSIMTILYLNDTKTV